MAGLEKVRAEALRIGDTIALADGLWVVAQRHVRPKTMLLRIRRPEREDGAQFDYTPRRETLVRRRTS